MIIARLSNGAFIVGIDNRNVELLKKQQPMVIDLKQHGGADKVFLLHGATLADVMETLKITFGETPIAQSLKDAEG